MVLSNCWLVAWISPLLTSDTGISLPNSSVSLSLSVLDHCQQTHRVVSFTSTAQQLPHSPTQRNKTLSLDSTALRSSHLRSLLRCSRSSLSRASASLAPLLFNPGVLAWIFSPHAPKPVRKACWPHLRNTCWNRNLPRLLHFRSHHWTPSQRLSPGCRTRSSHWSLCFYFCHRRHLPHRPRLREFLKTHASCPCPAQSCPVTPGIKSRCRDMARQPSGCSPYSLHRSSPALLTGRSPERRERFKVQCLVSLFTNQKDKKAAQCSNVAQPGKHLGTRQRSYQIPVCRPTWEPGGQYSGCYCPAPFMCFDDSFLLAVIQSAQNTLL